MCTFCVYVEKILVKNINTATAFITKKMKEHSTQNDEIFINAKKFNFKVFEYFYNFL